MLPQGKLEPTCHDFRRLVSLPLPNPDTLERPPGVQGAVPREQGSASPGPAALPVSQAQRPGITALDLLAHCAEVGPLQPVTMSLHVLPPEKGLLPTGRAPFLLHPQQSHWECCSVVCVPVCAPFLQGVQQQEQPAMMAANPRAADLVSGGKVTLCSLPGSRCISGQFLCLP